MAKVGDIIDGKKVMFKIEEGDNLKMLTVPLIK